MDDAEALIAQAALAPAAAAVGAWDQWKATNDITQASALLSWAGGYINRNLLSAGITDPYLGGIHRYNWMANNRQIVLARPIVLELGSRFTISPLKSFGLSEDVHSRGLRPLADFDFYVDQRHVAEARELLVDRGYRALNEVTEHEFLTRVVRQRGSWNFIDERKVDLDLHWRVVDQVDDGVSERLVAEFSTMTNSEFGRIRRLNNELMLVVLAVHHALQPASSLNLVFDFYNLLAKTRVTDAAAIAQRIGVSRELGELCATVAQLVKDHAHPALAELGAATTTNAESQPVPSARTVVPSWGDKIERRFFEPSYVRAPGVYRVWFALGRPLWLERLMIRLWGGIARTSQVGPSEDQFPARGGTLAGGWHFQFPWESTRWATVPDARVVFAAPPKSAALRIALDPELGPVRPTAAFDVVVNGRIVGTFAGDSVEATFAVPNASRRVEVSLRSHGRERFLSPGMWVDWYRHLAPVSTIELVDLG
jgi:hypothetical protein